jgi:hypothetical protein
MHHSKTEKVHTHVQEGLSQYQLYGGACAQHHHFADVYVDKQHDAQSHVSERRNSDYDIHPPNRTEHGQFYV